MDYNDLTKKQIISIHKDALEYIKEQQQEIERLKLLKERYQLEKENYKTRIDKAIEVIDLVKPELWNISNKMTYRLLDIKNILLGVDKE